MAKAKTTCFDSERWLPVPGHEGLYEVSDHGRVRSLDRVITMKNGRKRRQRGIVLKPVNSNGYHCVNVGALRYVHRLVLEAFVGPPPPGMETRHLDGDPHNNRLGNLKWGSSSENNDDIVAHGNHWQVQKESCPRGHPLVSPNLVPSNAKKLRDGDGRECLACNRARSIVRNHPEENYDFVALADVKFKEVMADAKEGRLVRANLAKTHCPRGHVLEMPNLVRKRFEEKGYRNCLACNRAGNVARSRGIKSEQFWKELADLKYTEIMGT